jgi:hypothetical protein
VSIAATPCDFKARAALARLAPPHSVSR